MSTLPKFRQKNIVFFVILEVILVILAVRTPKVLPGAPQREPKSVKNHQKVVSEPPWVSTGDLWGVLTAKITKMTSKITKKQCFFVEI